MKWTELAATTTFSYLLCLPPSLFLFHLTFFSSHLSVAYFFPLLLLLLFLLSDLPLSLPLPRLSFSPSLPSYHEMTSFAPPCTPHLDVLPLHWSRNNGFNNHGLRHLQLRNKGNLYFCRLWDLPATVISSEVTRVGFLKEARPPRLAGMEEASVVGSNLAFG